jgi:hypothetical protein
MVNNINMKINLYKDIHRNIYRDTPPHHTTGTVMGVSRNQEVEKMKDSIHVSYFSIVKRVPDMSVIMDLEKHLQDSRAACCKLTDAIANRSMKHNPLNGPTLAISTRQIKTDMKQKIACMWFKKHNARIRQNIVEIKAILNMQA